MGLSNQCQPGCMSFDGGEVKHRRDCVHYPESLTKIWHDTEAELRAENERLRAALHVTITRQPGVVPDLALEFYDPRHPALGRMAQS